MYSLTSWAAWVEVGIGLLPDTKMWTGEVFYNGRGGILLILTAGYGSSLLGFALYLLLNISYTTAVFTNPGSPGLTQGSYGQLPTEERGRPYTSFTVKSTGDIRYCKKCQCKKPDRAHHCSTCKRCVLKMDHHCPWLATCVGLHNYKPFLLFLLYTCAFCWLCFAVTATWLWNEVLSDSQYEETLMPVNFILLAILSGIIGLVLTGFTAWHVWLACKGRTTIESLEKTRYLAPLRKSMRQQFDAQRNYVHSKGHARNGSGDNRQSIGDQLREIHANALPGVTRPEEGEERSSPTPTSFSRGFEDSSARQSLLNNYERYNQDYEEERERDRYQDYLDEKEDEQMPNAFDLGYKKNLRHVFGTKWWLWWLPVCNTIGDGWTWEANPNWLAARGDAERRREARLAQESEAWSRSQNGNHSASRERGVGLATSGGAGLTPYHNQHMTLPQRMARDAQVWGANRGEADSTPLQTLSRSGSPLRKTDDSSTDPRLQRSQQTATWNDLPEEMLKAPSRRTPDSRSRSRSRRKESDRWENWDDRQNQ